MLGGHVSQCILTNHFVEALEHAPGCRQGGVDANGVFVCLDRPRRIFARHIAVASFLIQEAGLRMMQFHDRQGGERVINQATVPLRQGLQVQHIAVFRDLLDQRLRGAQSVGNLVVPQQGADALHFELDWRERAGVRGHRPSNKKRGRTSLPAL